MIYIYVPAILIILSILELVVGSRRSKIIFFIAILVQAIFFSCRYKVGVDWKNYLDFFNTLDVGYGFEIGYYFINLIFRTVGLNFWFLSALSSLLFFYAAYKFAWRYIPSPTFFITLFFLFNYFNQLEAIRSVVGFSFVLFGLSLYFERRIYLSLLIIFVATLFHQSMVVFFFVFVLGRFKFSFRCYLISLGVLTLFFIIKVDVVSEFLLILSDVAFKNRLSYYISRDEMLPSVITFTLLMKTFIYSFVCFFYSRVRGNCHKVVSFVFMLGSLYILQFFLFINNPTIVYRLGDLFIIGFIGSICFFADSISKKSNRLIFQVIIISIASYIYASPFLSSEFYAKYVIQYTSIIENIISSEKNEYTVDEFWNNAK